MENPVTVAAMILGALSVLFILIGMSTTYWGTGPGFHTGLYVQCQDKIGCFSFDATGNLAATRAFISIGFICALVGIIILLVYFFKYLRKNEANTSLPMVTGILFVISGVCIFIGIIILATGGKGNADLGYSFALTLIGGLMALVTGGLVLFHRSRISVAA